MLGVSLLVFPRLALGLSGFETGVSMMPLVRGDEGDEPERPVGRIRNTRKMLTARRPDHELLPDHHQLRDDRAHPCTRSSSRAAAANGRALAYVAHNYLGDAFGTVYDLSTIAILWFAGASAMAGLLNIVPRYLPRYGMAPEWGRAVRPLVLVYTAISFVVTIIFGADVDAQAGAYATGVLAMMTSAAFAVTSAAWRGGSKRGAFAFGLVASVFVYALVANDDTASRRHHDRLRSSSSRSSSPRSSRGCSARTELRQERIEIDETAQRFIDEAARGRHPHRRQPASAGRRARSTPERREEQREDNHIPPDEPILFLEVDVEDASEFEDVLEVRGVEIGGHKVLRAKSSVVPNAIAAFLLHLRDTTGKTPHCYFGWTEGNPIVYLFRFILFGEGDTAPVTHEVLREAEPDPEKRPAIHVGGR